MQNPSQTAGEAPDPARCYQRAKPEKEAGMGQLDSDVATPTDRPDQSDRAVRNAHPSHQLNAEDDVDIRSTAAWAGEAPVDCPPLTVGRDHTLLDEEPLGEDLMPTAIHDLRHKRHPRKKGKGGTP